MTKKRLTKRDTEKRRLYDRKRKQKQRDELHPTYIKQLLTQGTALNAADIPQELVKTKREHIKLGRKLKE